MDALTRKVRGESHVFFVYTEEEAKREGIEYKEWWKCDAGEYGLTDDGYVLKCIRRVEVLAKSKAKYNKAGVPWANARRLQLVWPIGTIFSHCFTGYRPYVKLLYECNKEFEQVSHLALTHPTRKKKTPTQLHPTRARKMARLLIEGMDRIAAYATAFSREKGDIGAKAHQSSLLVVQDPEFQTMLDEEAQKLLAERGITKKTAVEMLQRAITLGKDSKSIHNVLSVFDKVKEVLGMEETSGGGAALLEFQATEAILESVKEVEYEELSDAKGKAAITAGTED